MFFVTGSPVTFFLKCPLTGHFYFFFIGSDDSFVTILCLAVRMVSLEEIMNKLDTNPIALTYAVHPATDVACVDRLIVLVSTDIDYTVATRRIWELANATGRHVQLLGLCIDPAEESSLRRELITMASLLQAGKIVAEARVNRGTNWLDIVKANYETGDMIVCFAEQRTGLLRRPFNQILESNFKATVYILSDTAPQTSIPNRLSEILAWLGCIAIVVGFGILQTKIVQLPEDWFQSVLLILSIIPEFLLIWVWNTIFA
jgi:hypothetical protein